MKRQREYREKPAPYTSRRTYKKARGSTITRAILRKAVAELKAFDSIVVQPAVSVPIAATPPTYSEAAAAFTGITCINVVREGAAFYNRNGQKITLKGFYIRATTAQVGAGQSQLRTLIIYDRSPNGVAPAFNDILQQQPAGAPSWSSPMSVVNSSRFRVLKETVRSQSSLDATLSICQVFKIRCTLPSHFGANGGTIGDLREGAVYIMMFRASVAGVISFATGEVSCRTYFIDY